MRFSLVTITFNSEKFLEQTLQSVREQDFTDYEHILWDGGSTDRTLDIARSFPHVTIYEGQDHGISDAMNKGATMATGEYLLHLHSDDLLAHSGVLSFVDTFLQQHPQASWVYGLAEIIDAQGELLRVTPYIPFDARRLRKYNIITHPATFTPTKLFHHVGGFRSEFRYAMDYEFWLRLSQSTPGSAMPFTVSKFREHENSLSTKDALAVTDEAYKIRNKYVETYWERIQSYRTWKKRRKNIALRS